MAAAKKSRVNEQIDCPKVRVIDAEGEQAGVMSTADAITMAKSAGLDLVEVSPNAEPPVCRIMDVGKFVFEARKKQKEAKKKQVHTTIKEIKFRPGTDIGDYNIKIKKLTEFLEHGDKVKITMRFRGREIVHRELGSELLKRIEKDLEELATVEQFPKMEGRQMVMVMAPKKK
ncbi:MAG: translation initiation factor IF-3 [Gammaproteobacteria bacterium]|nr:translation initiation factor IF-3 [Gammaproteobacteria bacterium]